MSDFVWPPGLPQLALIDGYDETLADTLIHTQMEAGVDKVRRRFSAAAAPITLAFTMSADQTVIMETFYYDTLQGGALRFDYTHPRTGATRAWRFKEPPNMKPRREGGDGWTATIKLELMP